MEARWSTKGDDMEVGKGRKCRRGDRGVQDCLWRTNNLLFWFHMGQTFHVFIFLILKSTNLAITDELIEIAIMMQQ